MTADRVQVEVQYVSQAANLPGQQAFTAWAMAALDDGAEVVEIVIRIVDANESASLNEKYRGKQGPTNVLSFAADTPLETGVSLLGDLVICADVVLQEAADQGKSEQAHWAHMVVHGVLHLRGHDHEQEAEALRMEQREVAILASLGFDDPYLEDRS